MATENPPNVCSCCDSPCPLPYQERQVRTLGNFFGSSEGCPTGFMVDADSVAEALAELRAIPWSPAGGTATSYFRMTGLNVYMSESRARWVVPETHYGDDNIQDYARYKIGTYYNGGSGTTYTEISNKTITWNGPGGASEDSRATDWEYLLIDDWISSCGSVDNTGFLSRVDYTCYSAEVWT